MISANDRLIILEVLAAANRAADAKDPQEMADHYAKGAKIEGDMQASGPREDFISDVQTIFDNEPGLKRHVGSGHIFSEKGDHVVVKSLLTVFEGDKAPAVVATADIHDELVREGDDWKIARHVVTMDPGTRAAMAGES